MVSKVEDYRELVLSKEGKKIEVLSFFEEVPVRSKARYSIVEERFLQWEVSPRLFLAVNYTGKIYIPFLDRRTGEERYLEAEVTYWNKKIVETSFPKPSYDRRLERETLRVAVSPSKPIKVYLLNVLEKDKGAPFANGMMRFCQSANCEKEVSAVDISENGIGIILPKNEVKIGNLLELEMHLPDGIVRAVGEVTCKDSLGENEKVGVFFPDLPYEARETIYQFIRKRQKEILRTLSMF